MVAGLQIICARTPTRTHRLPVSGSAQPRVRAKAYAARRFYGLITTLPMQYAYPRSAIVLGALLLGCAHQCRGRKLSAPSTLSPNSCNEHLFWFMAITSRTGAEYWHYGAFQHPISARRECPSSVSHCSQGRCPVSQGALPKPDPSIALWRLEWASLRSCAKQPSMVPQAWWHCLPSQPDIHARSSGTYCMQAMRAIVMCIAPA